MATSKNKQRAKARAPQRRPPQRRAPQPRRAAATRFVKPNWPVWLWVWVGITALFFLLRAGGAITSVPLCVFLSAVAGALCFSFDQLRDTGPAHPLLRFRQIVLVSVLVAIPPLFDPSTVDIDDLPRLVVLVVAAVLILGAWAVDAGWNGWRPRRLVNGFQWLLAAIVLWFGVTMLTSAEPRQSFLGRHGSYEGFILIAALAVLSSALAESFNADSLPALFRVVVAATIPVLVYGAIQFYGFDVHKGSSLDFVQWHSAFHNVFSSLGNPNHLGGYLVTVLPLGVVTAVLARRRWLRVVSWGWVGVALVLVLQTAARGAWLASIFGGAILIVGLLPRLRASIRKAGLIGAGALVVAVALIAGGSRFLGGKASALFQFGSGSSVSQRYGYWSAALHLASHHPVVGTGPDTYAVTYAQYQGGGLAKTLEGTFFVNGVHNIFLSWLANEGVPGFILIVALFVVAIVWAVHAWRSSRTEAEESTRRDRSGPTAGETRRYLVAGLLAAFVAYFVQASFDVEQVGTLFMMFMLVGLLGVLNRGIWPNATLNSLSFVSRRMPWDPDEPPAEGDSEYPIPVVANRRSTLQAQYQRRRLLVTLIAGALGLTAVALSIWRTDAMWRADHDARVGTQATVVQATQLNPWEPSYFQTLGEAAGAAYAQNPRSPNALAFIQASVSYLRQDVALDGSNSFAQQEYGNALAREAILQRSQNLLNVALNTLYKAQREDPYNRQVKSFIQQARKPIASQ